MIEWNRDAASIVQLLLMVMFFALLLFKKKNLGKGINYFITAMGIVVVLDLCLYILRVTSTTHFHSIPFYTIGVNFGAFLLYFLYFHQILKIEKSKKINLILIVLFLLSYLVFAVFSENFFTVFPFKFYLLELVLLIGSIFLVLRETFNSDKVLNITSYFPFWVCIGLMVIYFGVTPLLFISNSAEKLMNVTIFFIILFIVNMIGYVILITGTLFAKNTIIKK